MGRVCTNKLAGICFGYQGVSFIPCIAGKGEGAQGQVVMTLKKSG